MPPPGTWYQERQERVVYDTYDDGNRTIRHEVEWHSRCRTQAFQYKLNVYNTPMQIAYDRRQTDATHRANMHD